MQQQIATLSQQMAHMFTELTFARTELAQRAEQQDPAQELAQAGGGPAAALGGAGAPRAVLL
jgi:hypothetical protein